MFSYFFIPSLNRKINKWIYELNETLTGFQMDLSKFGVRGDPHTGPGVLHDYSQWREPQVYKKLHLVDSVKKKIADNLIKLYHDMSA